MAYRTAILRHDPGLAASPPVRYTLKGANSFPAFAVSPPLRTDGFLATRRTPRFETGGMGVVTALLGRFRVCCRCVDDVVVDGLVGRIGVDAVGELLVVERDDVDDAAESLLTRIVFATIVRVLPSGDTDQSPCIFGESSRSNMVKVPLG